MVDKGEMIEYGTFTQLMAKKGHMSKLVSENVQILRESDELSIAHELKRQSLAAIGSNSSHLFSHSLPSTLPSIAEVSDRRSSKYDTLTREQFQNRQRLSRVNSIMATDENMAMLFEANQLLGQATHGQPSLIQEIERSRLSVVSAGTEFDEVMPSDAEPMKLVLEDQSVKYKVSPLMSYLRSGWGLIFTLAVFVLFFFVHLIRILSGIYKDFILFYFCINRSFFLSLLAKNVKFHLYVILK